MNSNRDTGFIPKKLFFTRRDLSAALDEHNLPSSTPRLNFFESNGIIKRPARGVKRGTLGYDRLYTEIELQGVVEDLKKYVSTRKTFGHKKTE